MRSSKPPVSLFRCLFLFLIIFSHSAFVHAEVIQGTSGDDTIVVISGTSYDGIISYEGDDNIIIESGAVVSSDDQFSEESIADAYAVAIDAGRDNDQIITDGSISANADAAALPKAQTASQATANATGIRAADGADMVLNSSTIATTATSDSESGDLTMTLDGNTQSESTTTSTAIAAGIAAGAGNNQVINTGAITTTVTSKAKAPDTDLHLGDTAHADADVRAKATGTGISGQGSIVNQRTGAITVTVSSQAEAGSINVDLGDSAKADANTTAYATATGIAGSENKDAIISAVPITVDATSNAGGSLDLESRTDANINATIEANSMAAGVDGGEGDDTITGFSTISSTATATANSDNINTSIWAPGVVDTTVKSVAQSAGITGGTGKDSILSSGSVTASAEAITDASSVLLSGGTEVALPTDVKGGITSRATTSGIDGGEDDDQITNLSLLNVSSSAISDADDVLLTLVGIGTFATPTTAKARSIGIDGGAGNDGMTNSNTLSVNATSSADSLRVAVSGVQYEATSDGDAKTRSEAKVLGMAGGDGDDKATNMGTITATASSTVSTEDISVELVGDVKSNSSTTSYAFATGIDGGAGSDTIANSGTVTASATSEAHATSVDVKFMTIPTMIAEKFGADLGDAKTAAQATATGIAGGVGDDTITNSGTVDVYAHADADSDNVTATLTITSLGGGSPKASGPSAGLQASPVVAVAGAAAPVAVAEAEDSEESGNITDTGTTAQAFVTGIDGGGGRDTIANENTLRVTAESDADSVSVNPTINIAKGGLPNIFPGMALADAETKAQATATGIDGGAGDDTVLNEDEVIVEAFSNSTSATVGVLLKGVTSKGLAYGGALSKAATAAVATATGLAVGDGDDTITNTGTVHATAIPDADSASVSATLMGAKEGLVAGFTYTDAATKAQANATGIDGGKGKDTITNTISGEIDVTANPTSSSAQVSATVEGSFSQEWSAIIGGAITDGTTKAISNSAGIDASDDQDTISNAGRVTVTANPDADSASVSVSLTGTEDGLTAGFTYADATTTADATAIGIEGGAGNDTITNMSTGQIEVTANPTSSSASVGVTLSGVTKGTGIVGGAALADSTTRAVSNVDGIKGDAGDDTITNAGAITVTSNPDADSASVSVDVGVALGELGLVGGLSYADTETTAEVTAVGIDGGTGNDTITNTGIINITTSPSSTGASIGVTVEAVKDLGGAIGAALTDGTTKAVSKAFGINGGEDEDSINNSGDITVISRSNAGSTHVSVDIVGGKEGAVAGVSYADATTTAEATATGIADQSGKAAVTHRGTILASSTAVTDSESVSVSATGEKTGLAAGVSLADLTTHSTAASYGIDTGETSGQEEVVAAAIGNDVVKNLGTVNTDATAITTAASVAVNLSAALEGVTGGVSAAKSDVTSTTTTLGVRTGKGDDSIVNDGIENADGYSLDSFAHATASSDTVAVTASGAWEGVALGASLAKADTQASATAVGIDAGDGSDTVTSNSGIRAKATAGVTSDTVSVDVALSYKGVSAGVALSSTKTDSQAAAAAISGGGGNDEVTNRSSLDAEATATTKTKTITINIATIGAAIAQASSTAASDAVGMDGGLGVDFLTNEGDITVQATSIADDMNATANFTGYASGNVDSTATATAAGIRGDDADDQAATGDTIANLAGRSVTVNSHAKVDARNYVVQGGGAALAEAVTTNTAQAAGIAGGAGADTVSNGGNVDVTAWSEADVSNMVLQLSGVSAGKAGADLTSRATGIDTGNGLNQITNESTGSISVTSKADATATSLTVNMGVALQRAAITSKAHSIGIKSGNSKDIIDNEGDIAVTVTSNMGAAAGDFSLAGLSTADSVTEASVEGINAGGGDDVVVNTGSITAGNIPASGDPMAYLEVANVSISFCKIGLGFLRSRARAAGILGGEGDDTIRNAGTIRIGDDDWMSVGKTVGFHGNFLEFFSLTGVGATGETTATGVGGGEGNDTILNDNSGVLNVKATAYAYADSVADTTTFGSPIAFANSTTKATATGVSGGQGDDVIVNLGTVTADARAWADAHTDSFVGWGSPTADSSSHATATALGVDIGEGQNFVRNEGEISSNSVASATSYAKADSNVDTTDAKAASCSEALAYGILAENDGNTVYNTTTGAITATALATTYDPQRQIETKAESDENATAKTSKPVTAYSAGIFLGDGDDTVVNDGSITAASSSDAGAYAHSDSWPNKARSDATAVGAATGSGISAGEGENSITNNGLIDVDAWGNASPSADSFSRDKTSKTKAVADARAAATGIEADGEIINAQAGSIEVRARAASHAETGKNDPGSEEAIVTARLTANATGIGTVSDTIRAAPDRIQNDGSISVDALTGEEDNENPELIARAVVDTETTENKAEARGASVADAAGIRVGKNDAEITNRGDIDVLGRARAHLYASSDEDSAAVSGVDEDTVVAVDSSGIRTADGNNTILNQGSVHVGATVDAVSTAKASSVTFTATAKAKTGASAGATGIGVGDGNNLIRSDGPLTVSAENTATALADKPSDHLDWSIADAGGNDTVLASDATGIRAGDGVNDIEAHNTMTVTSEVIASAEAYADTSTSKNHGVGYAGGVATGTGIAAADGQNRIQNYGDMTVSVTADVSALGHAEDYGEAYIGSKSIAIGSENTPGVTAKAIGIKLGSGTNEIGNFGSLDVDATATADAKGWAHTTSVDAHGKAVAISFAWATGIRTGDGTNNISNSGSIGVTATGNASAVTDVYSTHNDEFRDSYEATDARADGIQTGSGDDSITNHGIISAKTVDVIASHSRSAATGIDTGNGDNIIKNRGTVEVDASAAGFSTLVTALGVGTGNGADVIMNGGTIDVTAEAGGLIAIGTTVGISTGSGADVVINDGTIDATAEAGGLIAIGTTVGISTGDGDDAISNYGVITTLVTAKGVSSPGIGIDAGAGDDTVVLGENSRVEGSIDLGVGNDALAFVDNAVVTEPITGATGEDSLIFEGAGSVDVPLSEFESATKQGTGTYSVNAFEQVNRIKVNEGTLEINHNYQMAGDGTFQAQVNGDGSNGQLKVNGMAELAGDLSVVKSPGLYRNGTQYDILMGNDVNGMFSSEVLPEDKPLLSFKATTYADRVEVEAIAKSCTNVARNPVERGIARHLDRIMPTASGDLSAVLGEFQSLYEPDFDTAFSSLSPDSYDNSTRTTFKVIQQYAKNVQHRMNAIRASLFTTGKDLRAKESTRSPLLLAYTGSDASIGELLGRKQQVQLEKPYGLWIDGFSFLGDQDKEDGFTGFDYQLFGTAFGFDYALTDRLIAGVSVGYASTDIDFDADEGDGTIRSIGGSLYGTYFTDRTYIEGLMSYTKQRYANDRNILIGSVRRTADSDHDGNALSAFLSGGYNFHLTDWTVGPFASLQYIYLDEEGFEESGAGSINLEVDDRQTQSLVSELGLRVARVFKTDNGSLIPEISAAWNHDFDIDDRAIMASFSGSPGASFTIEGQDIEVNGVTFGAGVTFIHKSGFTTSLNYNGELRKDFDGHSIVGVIRFVF